MLVLLFVLLFLHTVVAPFSGYATHFDGIGSPYGGCGLPEYALETLDYVALNVQNTPGDYSTYLPRPITDPSKVGQWNNGYNCDRWVRVTMGDNCVGASNSGAPGSGFCKGGSWVSDGYTGATLDLIVTDSCQDGNEWCRDNHDHLDIHTSSLSRFIQNGQPVGSGILNGWNNRQITWDWVNPPNYTGDINIGFRQGAQPVYYVAIAIANLPNGIRGIMRNMGGGNWVNATMISDNGQAYQLSSAGPPYIIRIVDQSEALSKTYTFDFPSSCGSSCSAAFTKVPYTLS